MAATQALQNAMAPAMKMYGPWGSSQCSTNYWSLELSPGQTNKLMIWAGYIVDAIGFTATDNCGNTTTKRSAGLGGNCHTVSTHLFSYFSSSAVYYVHLLDSPLHVIFFYDLFIMDLSSFRLHSARLNMLPTLVGHTACTGILTDARSQPSGSIQILAPTDTDHMDTERMWLTLVLLQVRTNQVLLSSASLEELLSILIALVFTSKR